MRGVLLPEVMMDGTNAVTGAKDRDGSEDTEDVRLRPCDDAGARPRIHAATLEVLVKTKSKCLSPDLHSAGSLGRAREDTGPQLS